MKISQTCAFCHKSFDSDKKFEEFQIGPQFCCIAHLREFVEHFDPLPYFYKSEDEIDVDTNLADESKSIAKIVFRSGNARVANPSKVYARFGKSENFGAERFHEWSKNIEEDNNAADSRLSEYRCDLKKVRIPLDREPTVFSKLLGESFRSTYEVDVIEVMKKLWDWKEMLYEPHAIKMFYIGENQERIYVPDWYDPENVVYFEVKGFYSWNKSSKDKVAALSEIIGWRRMILIHPMYGREFGKHALINGDDLKI
jgi:hypothetical protein